MPAAALVSSLSRSLSDMNSFKSGRWLKVAESKKALQDYRLALQSLSALLAAVMQRAASNKH